MSTQPRISVITPTKNRHALLREAMDSVSAQTFADWEHIIVDDGSTDGTAVEVERRVSSDPRIRYVRRMGEKCGASVCRNLGLAQSRSPLAVFLDSDDLLDPGCLERRVSVMARNRDIDFAVFQTGVFSLVPGDLGRQLNPELLGDDLLRFLFFETPWQTTASTWRREALEKLGGFDEDLLSWQDIDLHIRAIAAGLRYLHFPEVDHHMRWHDDHIKVSLAQRSSPRHLEASSGVLEKFERTVRQGPGMDWVRQRALCSLYFFVAERWVEAGHLAEGLHTWRNIRARSLGPRHLHVSGASLLVVQSLGDAGCKLAARLSNKWKGWMRMRTNPELIADHKQETAV